MPRFRPGAVLPAVALLGAVAFMSGCVFVPVGPPVVAEPAIVVPAPVIVAPRPPVYRFHRGYYGGGYGRGYGRYWYR
jgi:hypothetical protein